MRIRFLVITCLLLAQMLPVGAQTSSDGVSPNTMPSVLNLTLPSAPITDVIGPSEGETSIVTPIHGAAMGGDAPAVTIATAAREFLTYSHTVVPLSGPLARKYQGVKYTLKNEKPVHLQILYGEVMNAVDEAAATTEDNQPAETGQKNLVSGFLRGLSALPIVSGLGYMSYATPRNTATSITSSSTAPNIPKIQTQGNPSRQEGPFVRKLNAVLLKPQQSFSFTALIPKDQKPHLKVVFKNKETGAVFTVIE